MIAYTFQIKKYASIMLTAKQELDYGYASLNRSACRVLEGWEGQAFRPYEVKTLYYRNLLCGLLVTLEGLEWMTLDILRVLFPNDKLCRNDLALQTLFVVFCPKRYTNCGDNLSSRIVIFHEVLFGWLSKYLPDEVIHEFYEWFAKTTLLLDMGCHHQSRPEVVASFA